ncbi:hypothetical protein E8E14_014518 [Neopestalotiopsis sp. 37M]|nr:hypothetical protein E8E14_014518 [Neopestalotiopsis sp. 37M]
MPTSSTPDEKEPFIGSSESHSFDNNVRHEADNHHRRSSRWPRLVIGAQLVFLLLNLFVLVLNLTIVNDRPEYNITSNIFGRVFSPARHALRYTVEQSNTSPSPFVGEPGPEVDQAWSHLLRSSMIKLSEEEMRKMNKTSIALRDGSGYIGYVESIHMLHCVKRMYQYQHQEYYPELQDTDAFMPGHWGKNACT